VVQHYTVGTVWHMCASSHITLMYLSSTLRADIPYIGYDHSPGYMYLRT